MAICSFRWTPKNKELICMYPCLYSSKSTKCVNSAFYKCALHCVRYFCVSEYYTYGRSFSNILQILMDISKQETVLTTCSNYLVEIVWNMWNYKRKSFDSSRNSSYL